jgi:hypothetical protein
MILIGSRALSAAGINVNRKPRDWDYMATTEEFNHFIDINKKDIVLVEPSKFGYTVFMSGFSPIEIEIIDEGTTGASLLKMAVAYRDQHKTEEGQDYLGPYAILALKLSHRYLKNSSHFNKTMDDIYLLRSLGYGKNFPSAYLEWIKAREKVTYDYKHPILDKKKKDFFSNDGVGYIYDHDTIHECVKHLDMPSFNYIKKDQADVLTSKEKFNEQSEIVKLYCVLEESYVLALERCLIPNYFKPDPHDAFKKALEKICTSITSGFFREYSWENYHKVLNLYNKNYVDKFHLGRQNGILKLYEGH